MNPLSWAIDLVEAIDVPPGWNQIVAALLVGYHDVVSKRPGATVKFHRICSRAGALHITCTLEGLSEREAAMLDVLTRAVAARSTVTAAWTDGACDPPLTDRAG